MNTVLAHSFGHSKDTISIYKLIKSHYYNKNS